MSKPWKQCPSEEHNPTKKKTKSSLSSTILDYYNKYGQNRDLEKYFRFRRNGRSSSDESSSNNNFQFIPCSGYGETEISTKSLENLSILRSQLDIDKKPLKVRSTESLSSMAAAATPINEPSSVKTPTSGRKSQNSLPIENLNDPQENKSKSNEDIKINVKNAHKSKRKSWNFNMESNVEIIFPPSLAMHQSLPSSQCLPQVLPLPKSTQQLTQSQLQQTNTTEYLALPTKLHETSQTQTDTIEFPKTPIQPIETKVQLTPMAEQQRPISEASSITSLSNKQRLEWDSLADIGYDKSEEFGEKLKKTKSSELTSFERDVLKKFFAQHGLTFHENIIFDKKQLEIQKIDTKLIKKSSSTTQESKLKKSTINISQEKPQNTNRWENAFHKILEEKLDKQHRSEPSLNGKQLWESALKKFRQKYGIRMNNSDLCITHPDIHSTPYSISSSKVTEEGIDGKSTVSGVGGGVGLTNRSMSMSPSLEIQSTKYEPKAVTKSTGAISKISKCMQDKQMIEEQQMENKRLERLEKACQTNIIALTSRESQSEVYESRENYNDPKSENSSNLDNVDDFNHGSADNDYDHDDNQIESSKLQKGLESATSFEFLSASAYEKEKKIKKQKLSFENKDKNSPSNKLIDENKENITPPQNEIKDENKENIPPLVLEENINSTTETENQKLLINLNSNADEIVQSILESSTCSRTHFDSISSKDSFFNDNSNFLLQPDVQKGVELLNSLVETTNMNKATKKKLIKKIVYRLMKIKYQNEKTETTSDLISTKITSPSSVTSTSSSSELIVSRKENITVSGVTTLNSTNSSNEQIPPQTPVLNDPNLQSPSMQQHSVANYSDDTVKDWLKPMTHSELDYEQQKSREIYQQKQNATKSKIKEIEIKQQELQDKLIEKQTKILDAKITTPPMHSPSTQLETSTTEKQGEENVHSTTSARVHDNFDENILRFVSKERNSQLDWIQKEINHLMNLKEFLMGEQKKREMEIMSELIGSNKKEPNYENIKAKNLSKKPSNYFQTKSLSPQASEQSETSLQKQSSNKPNPTPPPPPLPPPLESSSSISQSSSASEIAFQGNITSSTTTTTKSNDWNSHKNMKKLVRQNRTKLETPNLNDIEMYARAKQQDFIEKYQTKASKLYANNSDECLIYTQPYSSDHYSEPIENQRHKLFECGKSSSAVEPLQRHQYHHHSHHPHSQFHHQIKQQQQQRQRHQPPLPTIKRYHHHHQEEQQQQQKQQQQQLPQTQTVNDGYTSIATHSSGRSEMNGGFVSSNSMSISNGINSNSHSSTTTHQYDNANNSIGIQTGSSLLKTSPISFQSTNCRRTKLIKKSQQNKEQQTLPQPIAYTITFGNGTQTQKYISTNVSTNIDGDKVEQEKQVRIVKCAKDNFLSRAEERRLCIQELNDLRRKRNEQRQRLFLLSSNNNSLCANMSQLNPPPMEMCRRLFTTNNLKMISREKYKKLPEIKRKDEIERQNRLKRSYRFVMDIFNRNLQKRALLGNVNLSNSLIVSQF